MFHIGANGGNAGVFLLDRCNRFSYACQSIEFYYKRAGVPDEQVGACSPFRRKPLHIVGLWGRRRSSQRRAEKCGVAVLSYTGNRTSLTEDGGALSLHNHGAEATRAVSTVSQPRTSAPDKSEWFAAYTIPRHEKAVARQFDSRCIQSFLPLYRVPRRWKNGCKVVIEQPLFPSYIFICIDRRESVKVLQVPGVLTIVSAGRELAPLPTSEVEALRSGLPLRHFEPHSYLVVGEKVRITTGSFAGMSGVLVRKKNNLRVVLTLDLIRQSFAVEVGIDEIEPLKQ